MKKKIIGLAFIAMSLVAFTAVAQQNREGNGGKAKQENVKSKKCDKKKCDKDKKDCHAKMNPFEGMNLTESQKAQLSQLESKRKAARKEQAKVRKENKQRNDSARMSERRAVRKSYLQEVKSIIGPDRYVEFLENMYVNGGGTKHHKGKAVFKQGKGDKKMAGRDDKGRKGHRHGHRHPEAKNSGNV